MAKEHEGPEHTQQAGIGRRTLLRWVVGVGAFSSLATLALVLGTVKPQQTSQRNEKIEAGDVLVFALGPNKGAPITSANVSASRPAGIVIVPEPGQHKGEPIVPTSVGLGDVTLAFPRGKEMHDNLIILIHLKKSQFTPPTHLNWLPDGYVAYSAICTHLGCTVGYSYKPMPEAGVPYPHIHCPCHQGMYNDMAGAKVVSGPPPRPVPQLPLGLNAKGELVAEGPFDGPVGPLPGGR